jgi:hypothetical protein
MPASLAIWAKDVRWYPFWANRLAAEATSKARDSDGVGPFFGRGMPARYRPLHYLTTLDNVSDTALLESSRVIIRILGGDQS